ncbi:ABC transporter ATP-binding protein [Litoreibacter roseus]|uniref:ABC transporter ATP-binding protein n=1 Tax=Litoreibacter roseus TaxID=2601869 RepID=A0A6N6JG05_9RHOB|nr:ABC transporter ATP-binding protein [Litoreibacter roseus]GFE64897.1 ABC transporter ATP-binding protein [Litoreibacter roseus]
MLEGYNRMIGLLDSAQKRRGMLAICMMFVTGALDLAGVASILPFLAVLGNPDVIQTQPLLSSTYNALGYTDSAAFLRFLGVVVFVMVLTSIAVRALTFYLMVRFSRGVVLTLANRMLAHYLSQSYEWFLGRHSADLSKTVLAEVNQVVSHSISPAMRLIANAIVAILLLGLLLWLEPVGAVMTAFIIGGLFGATYAFLRKRLLAIGQDRKLAVRERFQITQEALGGIKEVKLLGLEQSYEDRFLGPSRRLARHQASLALVGEMPRYVMEALAFGGILLFILWVLWSNNGALEAVLPTIGAFAFAGLKLMPTLQGLFRDIAQIRFGRAALDELYDELQSAHAGDRRTGPRVAPMGLDREIRLEAVSYQYPGSDRTAIQDLSLSIPAKTSCGFVGSTGAGKTTVIDILLGLLRPSDGALLVDGVEITRDNMDAWQNTIGYVPQTIYLTDDTIAGNIAFGVPADEVDRKIVAKVGKLAKLDEFVDKLPDGYDSVIGESGVRLSGGQRQRIGIARALYRDPAVIVFDEAMSALDTVTERAVLEAIDALQGEKTILTITHRLSTIIHCDQIYMMKDGQVVGHGSYDELIDQNSGFRALAEAAE